MLGILKTPETQASVRINAHQDNVAGVKIPRFERVMTGASDTKMHLTGLGKGGQQVQQCRKVRPRRHACACLS